MLTQNSGRHRPSVRTSVRPSVCPSAVFFFKFAGATQVNSHKYKRGFIFRALSVARRGHMGILRKLYSLNSQLFLCSGGNRFGNCFICAFFAVFNRV